MTEHTQPTNLATSNEHASFFEAISPKATSHFQFTNKNTLIEELNKIVAVVAVGDEMRFAFWQQDGRVVLRSKHATEIALAQYEYVSSTKKADKLVAAFPIWLKSPERREYTSIVFETDVLGANNAFVGVADITHRPSIKAKLRIHVQTNDGPKLKTVNVKGGEDLFARSNEREAYRQGWSIAEIDATPDAEFIRFNNGRVMRKGEEIGGMRDDIWRTQIKHTIKKHLDKELELHNRGIKVLSLFFIDRVANYRATDEAGQPVPGKLARCFEEELAAFAKQPRYGLLEWIKKPAGELHNGYFAQDKKGGGLKDTKGDTQADDEVYNLIMRDKERLLSLDTPLRFIFSHSALREGWDNPNVFQICTLNESQSAMKKRQEIGRGLRLPVDKDGKRVFDDSINKLYVMANESYEDFARALQTEYEEDCGVTFGKVSIHALAKLSRIVDGQEQPIGKEAAEAIRSSLVAQKMLTPDDRIGTAFEPRRLDFVLDLPGQFKDLTPAVVDLLSEHQIERLIRRDKDERPNRLKKEVVIGPEFQELWNRIKPKTTYRVQFTSPSIRTLPGRLLQKVS